jgi:hypothetical protein
VPERLQCTLLRNFDVKGLADNANLRSLNLSLSCRSIP